jgi:hypothetical protein
MADAEALAITLQVARALEELGIRYLVGGSLASSFHGIPRSTQDADLVVDLRTEQIQLLLSRLQPDFYVDDERAREAVTHRRSFNLIHLASLFKVDLFVLKDEPYPQEEMRRRQPLELSMGSLVVASPEDTLLQKLLWYRAGNEVSERQWQDVLGILKVQRGRLDRAYLERWAESLDLTRLLSRATQESGYRGQ